MTVPISKHISGEQVRLALMTARPSGLTKGQLTEATGLTPSQTSNGLLWIKEVAAAEHLTPMSWTARDGYRFSDDPVDWVGYEVAQLRRILTTLSRLITGTADPHRAALPQDPFARMLIKNTEGMISTWNSSSTSPTPHPHNPPEPAPEAAAAPDRPRPPQHAARSQIDRRTGRRSAFARVIVPSRTTPLDWSCCADWRATSSLLACPWWSALLGHRSQCTASAA
jgi:hypothetical protein